jgi:hypothetical protein
MASICSVRVQHWLVRWQVHCFSKKASKLSIASSITDIAITAFRSYKTRLGSACFEMFLQIALWKKE